MTMVTTDWTEPFLIMCIQISIKNTSSLSSCWISLIKDKMMMEQCRLGFSLPCLIHTCCNLCINKYAYSYRLNTCKWRNTIWFAKLYNFWYLHYFSVHLSLNDSYIILRMLLNRYKYYANHKNKQNITNVNYYLSSCKLV